MCFSWQLGHCVQSAICIPSVGLEPPTSYADSATEAISETGGRERFPSASIRRCPSRSPALRAAVAAWPRWPCWRPAARTTRPASRWRRLRRRRSARFLSPALPDPLPSAAAPGPEGAALAALRADADAVLRAQGEAYWRLFTQGEKVDPGAAWRGREQLLSDGSLAQARAARGGAAGDRRAAAYLHAWLVGERLARDAADPLRELVRAREQAHVTWSDHAVALRSVPALLAGEKDRDRRRALADAAATEAGALDPLAQRAEARLRELSGGLGYASPLALAAELRGAPAPALATLAEDVLTRTDVAWHSLLDPLARAEGLGRGEARLPDLPRLLRSQVPARLFPAGKQVGMATRLLAGMGIDLARQANLRLSPEPNGAVPLPSLALPVDPPGDVRLALATPAGIDAARGALHELGAAEYYAHLPAGPMELRRLGPASVPQAWAIVFEEIAGASGWLAAQGVPEAQAREEARVAAVRRLLRVRESAARLLAAVARAQGGGGGEAALLARASGCSVQPSDAAAWLAEPDPFLRAAEGLRAELLAAQLEIRLAREAGTPAWWQSPAAGAWLLGAWADCAGRTPEEISASLGEKALDATALLRVVTERSGS